jgi:hypothetical protein
VSPWIFGVATSLIAWVISVMISNVLGERRERRRALGRVYDAIDPVLRQFGTLRRSGRLSPEDTQALVRLLSAQLASNFAQGSASLADYWQDEWAKVINDECGICGLAPNVTPDGRSCVDCHLNCFAWNH